jgi:hypothetical protein
LLLFFKKEVLASLRALSHVPGGSDAPMQDGHGTSRRLEESQVERCKYQKNADIRGEPLPKSVSEERDIDADYDGGHRHHVKYGGCRSAQSSGKRHLEFYLT